jgi:Lon protease-like protein
MPTVSPMFPLGTVLLPSMVLPLHIFEDRYREMVRHCVEQEDDFGVVLIERGSEVGGGDTRTDVGTTARLVEVIQFDDGRYALAAVGVDRIRVTRWLDDDPYPRAEVERWPDPTPEPDLSQRVGEVVASLRRLLARLSEQGEQVAAATTELSDDGVLASYQAVAMAPLGPVDKQRLLASPTAATRVTLLAELVREESEALDRIIELDS